MRRTAALLIGLVAAVQAPPPARAQAFRPDPHLQGALAAMVAIDARAWVGGARTELRFDALPRPAQVTSAALLARAYRFNAKAADAQFRDRLVLIEGRVTMVRPTEPPSVGLATNQPMVDIAAHAARNATLPPLMTDDRVALLCTGDGLVDGAPDLIACGPVAAFADAERQAATRLVDDWFAGGPPPVAANGTPAAEPLFRLYAALTLSPQDDLCRTAPGPQCWSRLLSTLDPHDGVQREAVRRLREAAGAVMQFPIGPGGEAKPPSF